MPKHIYISTGEVSGEQHAAHLAEALRAVAPGLSLSGMGGSLLREAGVETIVDTAGRSIMGFVEVVKHLPWLRRAFEAALRHIETTKPAAVILVDYPGFHLRLARAIKKRLPGTPVLYYIAPKVWAWNESRVERIRESVDKVLSIFPFEEAYFEERGVNVEYVGNPTVDAVRAAPDGEALLSELGVPSFNRLVALFPGSRVKELEWILPPMLDAAERLRDFSDLEFALALAPGFSQVDLQRIRAIPDWLKLVEGRNLELLAAADLAIAKSGTTTLEAALIGTPMVVAYRTGRLTAAIAQRLVRIPYASLPNIIAGRKIVPELLQKSLTADALASEASMLLAIPERADRMRAAFRELHDTLGEEPASARAARAVLNFLDGR